MEMEDVSINQLWKYFRLLIINKFLLFYEDGNTAKSEENQEEFKNKVIEKSNESKEDILDEHFTH